IASFFSALSARASCGAARATRGPDSPIRGENERAESGSRFVQWTSRIFRRDRPTVEHQITLALRYELRDRFGEIRPSNHARDNRSSIGTGVCYVTLKPPVLCPLHILGPGASGQTLDAAPDIKLRRDPAPNRLFAVGE